MSKFEDLGAVAKQAFEEVSQRSAKAVAKKAVSNVGALKRRVREIDSYWDTHNMSSPRSLYNKSNPEAHAAFTKIQKWQGPGAPMDVEEFVSSWNADARERARLIKEIKKATGEDWDTGY